MRAASSARAATCTCTGCRIRKRASSACASTSRGAGGRAGRARAAAAARGERLLRAAREGGAARAAIRAPTSASRRTGRCSASTAAASRRCSARTACSSRCRASARSSRCSLVDGELVTWADARITHALRDGDLPMPSVHWQAGDVGARHRGLRRRHARCGAGARPLPRAQSRNAGAPRDARAGLAPVPGESADAVPGASGRRERDRRAALGRSRPVGQRRAAAAAAGRTRVRCASSRSPPAPSATGCSRAGAPGQRTSSTAPASPAPR